MIIFLIIDVCRMSAEPDEFAYPSIMNAEVTSLSNTSRQQPTCSLEHVFFLWYKKNSQQCNDQKVSAKQKTTHAESQ